MILNKAMSLVVVAFALPFRAATVPFDQIAAQWPTILNLLAGSLIGAWLGAMQRLEKTHLPELFKIPVHLSTKVSQKLYRKLGQVKAVSLAFPRL